MQRIAKFNHALPNNISEIDPSHQQTIYPNPATTFITIGGFSDIELTHVVIYNIHGQTVWEKQVIGDALQLDIRSWNSGLYIIRMQAHNLTLHRKFTVQH